MKKHLHTHIMIIAAVAVATLTALTPLASATIRWLEKSYDFGPMLETGGKRTGAARFVNEGPDTTYIDYVRPSCGCTDADYTQGLILPGDTATVTFTYNPVGRPGIFDKTVKAYIGPQRERHVIRITGTVIGSPETLSLHYPVECGPIRLTERLIDLGEVTVGTGRHAFITIVNQTADTVRPTWKEPQGLSVLLSPQAIGPGGLATLGIYLNTGGAATAQLGERTFTVPLTTALPSDSTTSRTDSCTVDIVLRADFKPSAKASSDNADKAGNAAEEKNPAQKP